MHNRVEWNMNLQFYLTISSIKKSFNVEVLKTRLATHEILWCLFYTELLPTWVQLHLLPHFFISTKGRWYVVQATFVWSFFSLGGTSWRGDQECTSFPALAWAVSQTPRGCLGLWKIHHQTPKIKFIWSLNEQ